MFRCHVCGKTESRQELLSEVFEIDGKLVRGLSKFPRRSASIAENRCSAVTPPSEFDAWSMGKRNQSSRFRWTCLPISKHFWFWNPLHTLFSRAS